MSPPRKPPLPEPTRRAIVDAYEAGASMATLAGHHRTGIPRIRVVLVDAGVLRRPGTGCRYDLPRDVSRRIAQQYLAGASIPELMRRYHVGDLKVALALLDHGVDKRRRGPRPKSLRDAVPGPHALDVQ